MKLPFLIPLLTMLPVLLPRPFAGEATLRQDATGLSFGNNRLVLRFDRASGIWTGLETGAGTVLFRSSPARPSVDLRVGDGNIFPNAQDKPVLRRRSITRLGGATRLDLTLAKGDWEVTTSFLLRDGGTLQHSATFAYLGPAAKAGAEARNPILCLPALSLPGKDAFWFAPAEYPPRDHPFRHTDSGREFRFPFSDATFHAFLARSPERNLNLVTAYYSEDERSSPMVRELEKSAMVVHTHRSIDALRPGLRFTVGSMLLRVVPGSRLDALRALQSFYDLPGLRTGIGMPADTGRNIFYSAHPGGTIDSHFQDVGGFANFTKLLPSIRELGVNTLWLLPFWYGPVYAPYDYYRLDPKRCGTPAELRALTGRAHGLGMRVLGDLIPHGPREERGGKPTFAEQHPDWICRDKQGEILRWWGCLYTDYANPGWQDYMAKHAAYWVRECGLDGYRVDVAAGGGPNWRPYGDNRPSFSGLRGGLELMRKARAACLKENPKTIFLAESTGPTMYSAAEHGYHWAFPGLLKDHVLKDDPADFVQAMSGYLENQTYAFPADAFPIRYLTNHDQLRARYRYGPDLHRALLALCAFMKGAPLLYHEQEIGNEDFIAKLYRIRQTYDELAVGAISYRSIKAEPKHVFAIEREYEGKRSVVLINFSDQETNAKLVLPESALKKPGIYEAVKGKRIAYARGLTQSLPPYGYAVLVVRDATGAPPSLPVPDPPTAAAIGPFNYGRLVERFAPGEGQPGQSRWALQAPIDISRVGEAVVIKTPNYRAIIDGARGGLLREIHGRDGKLLLRCMELSEGQRKLFVGCDPLDLAKTKATLEVAKYGPLFETGQQLDISAVGQLRDTSGTARLDFRIVYTASPFSLGCSVTLTPLTALPPTKSDLALRFRFVPTTHWFASTTEGELQGQALRRHPARHGFGGRYWHGAGEAFYDGSLQPPLGGFGVLDANRGLAVEIMPFRHGSDPARARLLEDKSSETPVEIGGPAAVTAEIRLLDGERQTVWQEGKGRSTNMQVSFQRVARDSSNLAGPLQRIDHRGKPRDSRHSISGYSRGWSTYGPCYILKTEDVRAKVIRSQGGALARFTDGKGRGLRISDARFYTDQGLFSEWTDPRGKAHKMSANNHDDPEPDTQLRRLPKRVGAPAMLRFRSYFRHPQSGGRSVLTPRIEYDIAYMPPAQEGVGLRVECGVRPHLVKFDKSAFLAYKLSLSGCDQWQVDGGEWQSLPSKVGRIWESKVVGRLPTSLALRNSKTGDWTRFTEFVGGTDQVQSVFLHAGQGQGHLFVAFYDSEPVDIRALWRRAAFTIQAGGDR